MSRFIAALIAAISIFTASPSSASAVTALACGVTPADALRVFTTSLYTIYNVLPIKVGGVSVIPVFSSLMDDLKSVNNFPVCACVDPIPRVGVTMSLWEPIAVVEATSIPGCSPTLGMPLPTDFGSGGFSLGGHNSINPAHPTESLQYHWIKYPIFSLLQLFLDFTCLQGDPGLDVAYISEIDPLWQNDEWSMYIQPEVLLFANPIAQFACMADAVAATAGFPLTPLFWCAGSWGSIYPFTKNTSLDHPESSALITARAIYKMHRQLLLWTTIGAQALCGKVPAPIWLKHQYGIFPIYPVPWPYRIPIGRSGLIWSPGQDAPGVSKQVDVWSIYRLRDCCAF